MSNEFRSYVICRNVNIQNAKEEDYACIVPELFFEPFQGKFDVKATILVNDGNVFIVPAEQGRQTVKITGDEVDTILDLLDNAFHLYAVAFAVAPRGTKLYDRINVARGIIGNSLLREKYIMIPDGEQMFQIVILDKK